MGVHQCGGGVTVRWNGSGTAGAGWVPMSDIVTALGVSESSNAVDAVVGGCV